MEDRKQEDLDMINVFSSVSKLLKGIFGAIGWLIEFSLRKIRPLLLWMLLFVVIGISLRYTQKTYYSSDLSMSHIRFDNDYCRTMVNNLKAYLSGNGDIQELARELNMSVAQTGKIKSIRYEDLNDHMAGKYSDSTLVLLPFKIEVEVYNNDVLDTLEVKLLNYLENNEYALRRKEIDKIAIGKIEQKINEEIKETDSLKKLVNQSIVARGTGNGMIIGEPIDPVAVYKRGLDLYERNLLLSKKQQLNNSFEIIVGFIKQPTPSNPGMLSFILTGLLTGYIIGMILLLRKEYRNKSSQRA